MKSYITLFLLTIALTAKAAVMGEWKVFPAYYDITEIEKAGNMVFVLASGGLYSYDRTDHSVTIYDKSTVLNDFGIQHIAWCEQAKRLLIVYTNQNMDLLEPNGNCINLSDYYTKPMMVPKDINSIEMAGQYAYVATAFGILKINMVNATIENTYNLGWDVQWAHVDADNIYAESPTKGQYWAPLKGNLMDPSMWKQTVPFTCLTSDKTIDQELLQEATTYKPDGPMYNSFNGLKIADGKFFSVYGREADLPPVVQIFDGTKWTIIDGRAQKIADITGHRCSDFNAVAIDPLNSNHIFVGAENGLYEFLDGLYVREYTLDNSPLQPSTSTPGKKTHVIVCGLEFDKDNNLWCLNSSGANNAVLRLNTDNTWDTFDCPDFYISDGKVMTFMEDLMIDSKGELWFVNNSWNTPALCRFNPQTERDKAYKAISNQDNAVVNFAYVRCVKEDRDHNYWVGTDAGPVLLSADDAAAGTAVFQQVKVPRNDGTNLADYLLSNIDITCIVVDAGNRKWFGTSNSGVYLVSADNMEQIHHFTAADTPLLSDVIVDMVVDNRTGEVFISTSKGLCSFVSDATEAAADDSSEAYAYPNPVTPDYDGPITVVGLSYNAWIKIVSASGELVAEGRSNGGTFVWDGCDLDGNAVSSGVYMVMSATESGKKGNVCKVAIVR